MEFADANVEEQGDGEGRMVDEGREWGAEETDLEVEDGEVGGGRADGKGDEGGHKGRGGNGLGGQVALHGRVQDGWDHAY